MNDTQVSGWIRSLPRRTASPAFTSEVMRKVRRDEPVARPVWRLAAAFAMAACLIAVIQVAFIQQNNRRAAALRAEQQQIEAELEAVKRIAREVEPMVVLENGQGTRVIMDLDSAFQRTAHRTYD